MQLGTRGDGAQPAAVLVAGVSLDIVIIVAGALFVDPAGREDYLSGCRGVVQQARATHGCLDFALSADLVDPGRINVFEKWQTEAALMSFRGSGPSNDQSSAILDADVRAFRVDGER